LIDGWLFWDPCASHWCTYINKHACIHACATCRGRRSSIWSVILLRDYVMTWGTMWTPQPSLPLCLSHLIKAANRLILTQTFIIVGLQRVLPSLISAGKVTVFILWVCLFIRTPVTRAQIICWQVTHVFIWLWFGLKVRS